MLQAALSFGQPLPIRHLGRAGRPAIPALVFHLEGDRSEADVVRLAPARERHDVPHLLPGHGRAEDAPRRPALGARDRAGRDACVGSTAGVAGQSEALCQLAPEHHCQLAEASRG